MKLTIKSILTISAFLAGPIASAQFEGDLNIEHNTQEDFLSTPELTAESIIPKNPEPNSTAIPEKPMEKRSLVTHTPNATIAIVEDAVITMDDLDKKLMPFVRQIKRESTSEIQFQQNLEVAGREILENMINDILLVKDFKADKRFTIPTSYLENYYIKFMEEKFEGDRSRYIEFLKAKGMTDREFREEQKDEMILGFVRTQMKKSQSEISPDKIHRYYEQNSKLFAPESPATM